MTSRGDVWHLRRPLPLAVAVAGYSGASPCPPPATRLLYSRDPARSPRRGFEDSGCCSAVPAPATLHRRLGNLHTAGQGGVGEEARQRRSVVGRAYRFPHRRKGYFSLFPCPEQWVETFRNIKIKKERKINRRNWRARSRKGCGLF